MTDEQIAALNEKVDRWMAAAPAERDQIEFSDVEMNWMLNEYVRVAIEAARTPATRLQ